MDELTSYGEDLKDREDYHFGAGMLERKLATEAALQGAPAPQTDAPSKAPAEAPGHDRVIPTPLEALASIGETLSAPLRMLILKGLGKPLTATGKDNQLTGEDFRTNLGLNNPDSSLGDKALGLGAEILTDPTAALPIGVEKHAMKGAEAAAKVLTETNAAAKAAQTINKIVPESSLIQDISDPSLDLFKSNPTMVHTGTREIPVKDLQMEHALDDTGTESAFQYEEKYKKGEAVPNLVVREEGGKYHVMSGNARTVGAGRAGKATVKADVFQDLSPEKIAERLIAANPSMSAKQASIIRESVTVPVTAEGKHARATLLQQMGDDVPVIDKEIAKPYSYKMDAPLGRERYQYLQDTQREGAARAGVPVATYQNLFKVASDFVEKDPLKGNWVDLGNTWLSKHVSVGKTVHFTDVLPKNTKEIGGVHYSLENTKASFEVQAWVPREAGQGFSRIGRLRFGKSGGKDIVETVAVSPDYQRTGIATEMVGIAKGARGESIDFSHVVGDTVTDEGAAFLNNVEPFLAEARTSARVMGLDEAGTTKLAATLFLTRILAGASVGAYVNDDHLVGALQGAGIAASPELLAPLIKKVKASAPLTKRSAQAKSAWKAGYAEQRFAEIVKELKTKTTADVARPLSQVDEEARLLLQYQEVTPETLLKVSPNAVVDDAHMRAAQMVLTESADHLRAMALSTDISKPEQVQNFLKQLYIHGNMDFGRKYAEGGIGRALNVIDSNKADLMFLKQMDRVVNEAVAGVNPQRIVELARETTSLDHLTRYANSMSKPGFKDMFVEYWVNGLLSGMKTLTLNPVSSALFHGLNMFERGASLLYGNAQGPKQAIAMFQSSMSAFKEAMLIGWEMLKKEGGDPGKIDFLHNAITAENVKNLAPIKSLRDKLMPLREEAGPVASAIDYLAHVATKTIDVGGQVVRLPRRVMLAQDEFVRSIAQRAEIHSSAVTQATADVEAANLSGKAARDYYAQRFKHWVDNPSPDAMRRAKDYGSYITFTRMLGETGQAVQQFSNSSIVGKAAVPFVTAPVNIAKTGFLERTPLGLLSNTFREELKAGGQRRQLALTRMSMGGAFMAMATEWVAQGYIVGPGPDDPQLAKALKQAGQLPFAINVSAIMRGGNGGDVHVRPQEGDILIDFTKLDPAIAPALTLAALYTTYRGRMSDADASDVAAELTMAVGQYVGQKSWLSGAAGITALITDPTHNMENFLKRQVGTLVPSSSFTTSVAREIDPIRRDPQSLWQGVLTKLPYLSRQVIPDRNRYGEIVHYPPALGPDIASQFYYDTVKDDKVLRAMQEDEINLQKLPNYIQNVVLPPELFDEYRVIFGQEVINAYGQTLREAEEAVLAKARREGHTTGPDSWRKAELMKVDTEFRAKATKILLRRHPDLAQAVVDDHREKLKKLDKPAFSPLPYEIEVADMEGVDVKRGKSKSRVIPFTVR